LLRAANKATGLSHQFGNSSLKERVSTRAQASSKPIVAAVKMEVSTIEKNTEQIKKIAPSTAFSTLLLSSLTEK
jgi:hypothetical protein